MLRGVAAPDLWFLDDLIVCTGKVLARSGNGDHVVPEPRRLDVLRRQPDQAGPLVAPRALGGRSARTWTRRTDPSSAGRGRRAGGLRPQPTRAARIGSRYRPRARTRPAMAAFTRHRPERRLNGAFPFNLRACAPHHTNTTPDGPPTHQDSHPGQGANDALIRHPDQPAPSH
jgi:hypothetical protein